MFSTLLSILLILCTLEIVWGYYSYKPKMTYRMRSPLLRTVYSRMMDDARMKESDHSKWYEVDTSKLPSDICDSFLQCDEDEETKLFLAHCYDKAEWVFTQIGHQLAKSLLSWFISQTSINGLLNRGSMFVFSKSQFRALLAIDENWKSDTLLDLGAGDGEVTKIMESHFNQIFVTEASTPMLWRLKKRQYKVLEIDEWNNGSQSYDVISCLNLLDRCERPITLLHHMRTSLTPHTGRLILAVVLPFKPYVEFGGVDHKPYEFLHVQGQTVEEQIVSLVKNVFEPAKYKMERFTRVPYLCEGDLENSFYLLNDIIFVLKPS